MNETEPTLEESMMSVLATLPMPVREYLTQGGLENTARVVTAKYNLHIDQGAVVQRELMLVLMGIEPPSELAETLHTEVGLEPEAVSAILEDINRDVFQPLQEKIKSNTEVPRGTPVTAARPVPMPPANLPGAGNTPDTGTPVWPQEQAIVYAASAPRPTPVPPAMPQTKPQQQPAPRPIIKEYASDPYHEPI